MSPKPMIRHQDIGGNLYFMLRNLLKDCNKCKVLYEIDYKISNDTVVSPDLVVVCGDDIGETYLKKTPSIVVEILSPSTAKKDKTTKYRLYQESGVAYYLIVDIDKTHIDIYHLENGSYTEYTSDIFDINNCKVKLNLKEIFN
jgi:Uma2 family endonuclease